MTISPSAGLLGLQEPAHLSLPPSVTSAAGQEAAELAEAAGLVLDPWERFVLEHALGERENGEWSAFEVALIVPRQNGKGSVLEARELAGLFLFGEDLILHSAHEFKTAQEAFRRVLSLIESTPDLERRVMRVRTSHGEEGIELKTRQRLRFVARSTGSGRGFTGDVVILDEAFHLLLEGIAALLPTMAARPNPQLWYTSSAPLPHAMSSVLRALCQRGRAGESSSLAYFEWCAAKGVDLDDRGGWARSNPALGIRISEEFVAREREALGDAEFARERLGIWSDVSHQSVIPAVRWARCADPAVVRPEAVCLSFDVAPDRCSAAIGVAGRVGDRVFVDVAQHGEGTSWLVDQLVRLNERYRPVRIVCDAAGPAASLLSDLDEVGVAYSTVTTREHVQACGALYDDVVRDDPRLVHPNVEVLNNAVEGADTREVADAWLWSRKNSSVDISPLVAVTLARWAACSALIDVADSVW